MPTIETLKTLTQSEPARRKLAYLYGTQPGMIERQVVRHLDLLEQFQRAFPGARQADFFSAPGRTEVGGNHTDHNAGRVLAAAVNLDILAVVSPSEDGMITVRSAGYPAVVVNTTQLDIVESERYTSTALARGVCARLAELGYRVGGFDAVMTSDVPKGAGLSSSAAYEVLMVAIQNYFYNNGAIPEITGAQVSQFAENVYFGKPCGLMDQTTCMVGGFVTIDFADFAHPLVHKVAFDFARSGYALVIVETGGNHADLNEDYAALEHEMKAVAKALGGQVLRQFSKAEVLAQLRTLRRQVSDRAILRAIHFYDDDQRVVEQVAALEAGDFERFQHLIIESGESSWMLCQNVFSCKFPHEQGIAVALTASQNLLAGDGPTPLGAWRVHGGGFAGTIQAFVPEERTPGYMQAMQAIFGEGTCYRVSVRPVGAIHVSFAE